MVIGLVLAAVFIGFAYLLFKERLMNRPSSPSQSQGSLVLQPFHLAANSPAANRITLFLCGDVMTGRGIDQVLPFPLAPDLYESYVKDARDYVGLAERKNSPIPKPVDFDYIWGDALRVWQQLKPDLKIINLETSITVNPVPWPEKEVHYRMHPRNVSVLSAAGIDLCILANNHTLDWGRTGLLETLRSLDSARLAFAGAGQQLEEALAPVVLKTPKGRVVVLAYSSISSGTPYDWAAGPQQPGINLLANLSTESLQDIAAQVKNVKKPGDVVVFSVHWGSNWGYEIPPAQQNFARQLIDKAGVDLVFGHSSHHPRPIEIYRGKLILYGAGDFINDYEGISGHEQYRADLSLMYFPQLDPANGKLTALVMVPMRIRNFRLQRASPKEAAWLADRMARESSRFGTTVSLEDNSLVVQLNSR